MGRGARNQILPRLVLVSASAESTLFAISGFNQRVDCQRPKNTLIDKAKFQWLLVLGGE
jgi:hypothetical protein